MNAAGHFQSCERGCSGDDNVRCLEYVRLSEAELSTQLAAVTAERDALAGRVAALTELARAMVAVYWQGSFDAPGSHPIQQLSRALADTAKAAASWEESIRADERSKGGR